MNWRLNTGRRGEIAFVCERCDRPVYGALGGPDDAVVCVTCGERFALRTGDAETGGRRVEQCLRCGADRLYIQKDFNRKLGLAVFVVAAILSVPTWGLSLLIATLFDLGLYYCLGSVTICYACGTQHRGFPLNPAHGPFDLHTAEAIDNQPRAV